MDFRKITGDMVTAFLSQGVSLLVSAATSLVVPKALGVTEFGYWQLFLFYSTYIGFFHFGLNDGVYLLNGGSLRNDVDKRDLNSQFIVGVVFQSLIAFAVVLLSSSLSLEGNRAFVIVAVSIYMVIYNALYYLGYMFQAFGETRLFSRAVLVSRVSFIIPLATLLLFGVSDYRFYVLGQIGSQCIALVWSMCKAKDVLNAGLLSLSSSVCLAFRSVRVGIKLMLSNIASSLVLGILRFVVDAKWGIEVFGQLSLSLSLVNFILAFVSQVGMVLFPALRRADRNELKKIFSYMQDVLALGMPACYGFVQPVIALLSLWLPAYKESLIYLIYLLPVCVFDAQMSILGTTYLKVLRGERALLLLNMGAVSVSAAGAVFGIGIFDSLEIGLLSVVLAIALRSIAAEAITATIMGIDWESPITLLEFALTIVYFLINTLTDGYVAFGLYLFIYAVFLFAFKGRITCILDALYKRLA